MQPSPAVPREERVVVLKTLEQPSHTYRALLRCVVPSKVVVELQLSARARGVVVEVGRNEGLYLNRNGSGGFVRLFNQYKW